MLTPPLWDFNALLAASDAISAVLGYLTWGPDGSVTHSPYAWYQATRQLWNADHAQLAWTSAMPNDCNSTQMQMRLRMGKSNTLLRNVNGNGCCRAFHRRHGGCHIRLQIVHMCSETSETTNVIFPPLCLRYDACHPHSLGTCWCRRLQLETPSAARVSDTRLTYQRGQSFQRLREEEQATERVENILGCFLSAAERTSGAHGPACPAEISTQPFPRSSAASAVFTHTCGSLPACRVAVYVGVVLHLAESGTCLPCLPRRLPSGSCGLSPMQQTVVERCTNFYCSMQRMWPFDALSIASHSACTCVRISRHSTIPTRCRRLWRCCVQHQDDKCRAAYQPAGG